eukprot:11051347-Ditylum_brightwellii.AAC.1
MLDKFVSKPSLSQITENLLQALKQFRNSVCWKEFWYLKRIKELLAKTKKLFEEKGKDILDEAEDNDNETAADEADFEGLGTGLRLVERLKYDLKGLEDLEHFFHRLETTLLEKVKDNTLSPKLEKDKNFNDLFVKLQKETKVVEPTDKTNNFTTVVTEDYIKWVEEHLEKWPKWFQGSM